MININDADKERIKRVLQDENEVKAIKYVRDNYGVGLSEAKEVIDGLGIVRSSPVSIGNRIGTTFCILLTAVFVVTFIMCVSGAFSREENSVSNSNVHNNSSSYINEVSIKDLAADKVIKSCVPSSSMDAVSELQVLYFHEEEEYEGYHIGIIELSYRWSGQLYNAHFAFAIKPISGSEYRGMCEAIVLDNPSDLYDMFKENINKIECE